MTRIGFTLVELSIVLVVVGLLIGGILVGQSLIESAKIQKTIRQITDYNHGTSLFVQRFKYFPGDFPQAVEMLGATTNGNGNRIVGIGPWNRYSAVPAEESNFYQHLTKAGMVNFIPAPNSGFIGGGTYIKVGANTPELAYKGVGILPVDLLASCSGALCFEIGGWKVGSGGDGLNHSGINAIQTMAIDAKIDNGLPTSGNMRSWQNDASTVNSNTTCVSGSAYITSTTATGCYSVLNYKEFGY